MIIRTIIKRILPLITLAMVFFSSCVFSNTVEKKLLGKTLFCDSLLIVKDNEIRVVDSLTFDDISILLWIDSTECSPCELVHLSNYEHFNDRCESILGVKGCMMVVFSPKNRNVETVILNDIKDVNFPFDILIDYKNTLSSLLGYNNRLLLVLEKGNIIMTYLIKNTDSDKYQLEKCLNYLKHRRNEYY
jgi:hypothetical protein